MKYLIATVFTILSFFSSTAQEDNVNRARIREVQQNNELYLRGDVTDASAEKALKRAMDILQWEVEQYADTAQGIEVVTTVITDKMVKVEMVRGDKFRAFVYVKKSDITQPLPAKQSKQKSPKQKSPKKKQEMPTTQPASTAETKMETMPAPPPLDAPDMKEETSTVMTDTVLPTPTVTKSRKEITLEKILAAETLAELQTILPPMKKAGDILDYNKYSALSDASFYYVAVYDREGRIKAFLSPGHGNRKNLKTNVPDKVDNYKGHGAIGIRIAK